MGTEEERIELDLQEWLNLFAGKADCAKFCNDIIRSIVADSSEYIEKVKQYYDKCPEVMSLLQVRVELNVDAAVGRLVHYGEMLEIMKKGEE